MCSNLRRKSTFKLVILVAVFCIIGVYLLETRYDFFETYKKIDLTSFMIFGDRSRGVEEKFVRTLAKYAKTVPRRYPNETDLKLIILAMTDNAFFDMALNLYLTSFKRFGITNFLFVGAGRTACVNLLKLDIQCFYFTEDSNTNQSNIFGTREFIKKMNIRTDMIISSLRANFSVLHTDLDVVFLNNPMPNIEESLRSSNMAILWDFSLYNAGFLVIKPTPFSLEVYLDMQSNTNKSATLDDQSALNNAIKSLQAKYKADPIFSSVGILDKSKYLCGKCYFEVVNRNFPWKNGSDNCPGCLVAHNNWIVSMEAKVYRFKEINMWWIDRDAYYSDVNRKYLLYNNPYISSPLSNYSTDVMEMNAFKTGLAMAQMLNRTLIIPRFHCLGPKNEFECSALNWIYLRVFDPLFKYRENSFLSSHLVPEAIRKNLTSRCAYSSPKPSDNTNKLNLCSPKLKNHTTDCFEPVWNLIETQQNTELNELFQDSYQRYIYVNFKSHYKVPEAEILKSFGNCDDQVLYIASLLGVEVVFTNKTVNAEFETRSRNGIVRKNYMQY